MTDMICQISPSMLRLLNRMPFNRTVIFLLRHSIREQLDPMDVGYSEPITTVGRQLAIKLGRVLYGRLRTVRTSPLLRCVQTAEALVEGAELDLPVIQDQLLGDPGVYVLDDKLAWENWKQLGHEGVMRHLVTETKALRGMAPPDEAARFLVYSMVVAADKQPGIHVFVTHDLIVTATVARFLGKPLDVEDWPWYLEGAFFWDTEEGMHAAYRDEESIRRNFSPLQVCPR